jgi:hypothetical protein
VTNISAPICVLGVDDEPAIRRAVSVCLSMQGPRRPAERQKVVFESADLAMGSHPQVRRLIAAKAKRVTPYTEFILPYTNAHQHMDSYFHKHGDA